MKYSHKMDKHMHDLTFVAETEQNDELTNVTGCDAHQYS